MKIVLFDTHHHDRDSFTAANHGLGHDLTFLETPLTHVTAALAAGHDVVCAFVNDHLDADVLALLHRAGVRLIALRSAGFNHVDLAAAARLGLPVVRVPEYSPHAVAEHAVALVLALVRQLPRAHARVRDGNFSLDGLVGFDLYGKTVGLVGLGRIGLVAARIFAGFGCTVLGHDLAPVATDLLTHVSLDELYRRADILSLHVPLTHQTRHLVDAAALARMKPGVIVVNTGRGALIDTPALIDALKRGHVGGACLDVYEEEEGVFFADLSGQILQDDVLARLLTFPNVLITSHQAFLTREALAAIADTTLASITAFAAGAPLANQVRAPAGA